MQPQSKTWISGATGSSIPDTVAHAQGARDPESQRRATRTPETPSSTRHLLYGHSDMETRTRSETPRGTSRRDWARVGSGPCLPARVVWPMPRALWVVAPRSRALCDRPMGYVPWAWEGTKRHETTLKKIAGFRFVWPIRFRVMGYALGDGCRGSLGPGAPSPL